MEAKLAAVDLGLLAAEEQQAPLFLPYSEAWLKDYAELECKTSTVRSYKQLLRVHVQPRFGAKRLTDITREQVKAFIVDLSQASKLLGNCPVPKFSRNTVRLIVCSLRAVLSAAVEDGMLSFNPASRLGRYTRKAKPSRASSAMTRDEVEKFLSAVDDLHPEWKPFFLTALRAGLRKGELIALQWGDIQFGEHQTDPNRYILVQRNWSCGSFTTPKNKKSRRVDLSQQLRALLLELRDARQLKSIMMGKTSIADELVFPSKAGTVLKPDNIAPRYLEPCLMKAGLRRFTCHDLRHTFGSLLIQDGAPLSYVKEQMGHSSIQITVDTYGHLVPGADIAWVDGLDSKTRPQRSATGQQQNTKDSSGGGTQTTEKNWLPPRDSNPDMLIQSQLSYH